MKITIDVPEYVVKSCKKTLKDNPRSAKIAVPRDILESIVSTYESCSYQNSASGNDKNATSESDNFRRKIDASFSEGCYLDQGVTQCF